MKPRTERPNPWMLRARAAKADRLVAEINDIAERLGVTKSAMLNAVSLWGQREWSALSVRIGKKPPSDATITSVLATLSKAALVERLATDVEPHFSSDRDARTAEP